jgi:hydrogenase small subunit
MSPFYGRLPNVAGFGVETTAEQLGVYAVAGVAALSAAHGIGKAIQRRSEGEHTPEDGVPQGPPEERGAHQD